MRRVPRTQGRSFAVGIGVLLAAALIAYVSFTANEGRLPLSPSRTVRAAFADAGTLNPGDEVRENSIRVGTVSKVDIKEHQAVVTMDLTEDRPLYANATAQLWDQSALGQKFVELKQGAPATGPLQNRVIPASRTDSDHDLSDVLDVLNPPTRQALSSSLRELGGGAGGHGKDVNSFLGAAPSMLGDLQNVSGALSSRSTDLPGLIQSAQRLSSRFDGRQEQISSLLRQTDATLAAVNVDGGRPLDQTVGELPGTLHEASRALDSMDRPLVDAESAVGTLRPGARALGEATPALRGVLRDGVRPLDKIPGVAQDADPAVGSLTDALHVAQPVVPKVAEGLNNAQEPLKVVAPYACDLGETAFDISKLFTSHAGYQHQLRIMAGAPDGATVNSPVTTQPTDPYPAPCSANRNRAPLGGVIPPLTGGEPR